MIFMEPASEVPILDRLKDSENDEGIKKKKKNENMDMLLGMVRMIA